MTQQDLLRRFVFEEIGVRGLWVRLSDSWQTAREHQCCASHVLPQLGQALTAVVLLSSIIKFKGSLILQIQGDGDLKTLVAQATHDRKIRGLLRASDTVTLGSMQAMFGEGRVVITVSSEPNQPYQGIVPLLGETLADVLETYFTQSEQLNTRLWLFANENHTTGLLLQELPSQLNVISDWERIEMLANTITERELMELDCEDMLYRLFHEEKVRIFDPEPIEFDCSCSRLKIENALRTFSPKELTDIIVEQGKIDVNCEFCNKHYQFDKIDVEQLLNWNKTVVTDSNTRH